MDDADAISLSQFLESTPEPSEGDNFLVQWVRLMEAYQVRHCTLSTTIPHCVPWTLHRIGIDRASAVMFQLIFHNYYYVDGSGWQEEMASAARDAVAFLHRFTSEPGEAFHHAAQATGNALRNNLVAIPSMLTAAPLAAGTAGIVSPSSAPYRLSVGGSLVGLTGGGGGAAAAAAAFMSSRVGGAGSIGLATGTGSHQVSGMFHPSLFVTGRHHAGPSSRPGPGGGSGSGIGTTGSPARDVGAAAGTSAAAAGGNGSDAPGYFARSPLGAQRTGSGYLGSLAPASPGCAGVETIQLGAAASASGANAPAHWHPAAAIAVTGGPNTGSGYYHSTSLRSAGGNFHSIVGAPGLGQVDPLLLSADHDGEYMYDPMMADVVGAGYCVRPAALPGPTVSSVGKPSS